MSATPLPRRLSGAVFALEWGLMRLVALALFAMMALTFLDVSGRYLFNAPLGGAFEITELALGFLVFATFPILARDGRHIRLDLLSNRLPPRAQRWHEAAIRVFSGVVLAVIAWRLFKVAAFEASVGYTTLTLGLQTWPFLAAMGVLAALSALLSVVFAATFILEPGEGAE
ncbi:Tripartite ATP-independent periplasmic transporters, DctQ component [Roseivivax jejudonensis]|uniref:TRAP transporter small permease protein n=1 Tax=Roseivivax jejudonensis TaxID=1529041 RepID=A0A1X6ZWK8_9RHOB|nr:TRAP transporter small permease [Roseivivax jejudonensis]SLN63754.1 Tripartite ATP-independent periplasmic transporters, DctQ component [Roseivivax jejudonensis]